MTPGFVVAVLVGAAPGAKAPTVAAAPPPKRVPAADTGPGTVNFVTTDAVYVNRGGLDGVKVGDSLPILHSGKPVANCEVTALADHSAVCRSAKGVRAGDQLSVTRTPGKTVAPLAPLPGQSELAAQFARVHAEAWPLVELGEGGPSGRPDGAWLRFSLAHLAFADLGATRGSFQLEQLNAAFNQPLGHGLSVAADGTLLIWSRRPVGSAYPRTSVVQPFVRQLELTWRPNQVPLTVRVGRVRPRHVPGLYALDGAQVGYHLNGQTAEGEFGLYGGLLPDTLTTMISTSQFSAGAYAMGRVASGSGAEGSVFQGEARAGWAVRPNLGSRFEAATSLHGWVGRLFDAHGAVQFGLASALQNAASLDVATLDVGLNTERLRVHASGRYRGNSWLEAVPLGVQLPTTQSLHASADVTVTLSQQLLATVRGGVAFEFAGPLQQGYVGPEVTWLPWQGRVGLSASYQEELGWLRGRTFGLGASVSPTPGFRVQARGSWFQQPTPTLGANEWGAGLGVDARLASFLVMRLSGSYRNALSGPQVLPLAQRSSMQAMAQFTVEL